MIDINLKGFKYLSISRILVQYGGANFASSPSRVLIHCLDPVFICEKIAYTRIDQVVSITDAIDNTITGIKGIGGLQTRGKYREGYPKSSYI